MDEVIRALVAEGRIKKMNYNTYEWTSYIPGSEERKAQLEPIIKFLNQNPAADEIKLPSRGGDDDPRELE